MCGIGKYFKQKVKDKKMKVTYRKHKDVKEDKKKCEEKSEKNAKKAKWVEEYDNLKKELDKDGKVPHEYVFVKAGDKKEKKNVLEEPVKEIVEDIVKEKPDKKEKQEKKSVKSDIYTKI